MTLLLIPKYVPIVDLRLLLKLDCLIGTAATIFLYPLIRYVGSEISSANIDKNSC